MKWAWVFGALALGCGHMSEAQRCRVAASLQQDPLIRAVQVNSCEQTANRELDERFQGEALRAERSRTEQALRLRQERRSVAERRVLELEQELAELDAIEADHVKTLILLKQLRDERLDIDPSELDELEARSQGLLERASARRERVEARLLLERRIVEASAGR